MNQLAMLKSQFDDLALGEITDLLRSSGPSEWPRFATAHAIEARIEDILAKAPLHGVRRFNPRQVASLARRLLLARDATNLEMLSALWCEFGASKVCCARVVAAVKRVLSEWRRGVSRGSDSLRFSPALANFLAEVQDVCRSRCPLCDAIRAAHFCAEEWPGGFPAVVKGNASPWLASSVWVPLVRRRARASPKSHWGAAWRSARKALCEIPSDLACPSLAPWFERFIRLHDGAVETLASGSFAALCEALAWHQGRRLPFGVGFTGFWDEDGKLSGVTDLNLKLQAAADAGVFLLFACQDPREPAPEPVDRVRLILLEQCLPLADVIRQVNRVCAESGLTEYRWRRESRKLEAPRPSTIDSCDLPSACRDDRPDEYPISFVGRDLALATLQGWHCESRRSKSRQLRAVVGAARTGKTTLLSKWGNDKAQFPFFPVWFSFRRGLTRDLAQMKRDLKRQIDERYVVLELPESELGRCYGERSGSDEHRWLETAAASTEADIDIIVDGIDEIPADEAQLEVLRALRRIAVIGLVVIGSQDIAALQRVEHVPFVLRNDDSAGRDDALELVDLWADEFERQGYDAIAGDLRSPQWRQSLVERSGGNLAVLNDALKTGPDVGWPSSPDGLTLHADYNVYCHRLLDQIRGAGTNFKLAEEFIAFRAFLDRRPWPVADVLKLMGRENDVEYALEFSGDGPAGMIRFVRIDGGRCQFQSSNLLDFARQHFSNVARVVAEHFIELLREPPFRDDSSSCGAEEPDRETDPEEPPSESLARELARRRMEQERCGLARYAVHSLPTLICSVGDVALIERLLQSSWFYRRLCTLRAQIVDDDYLSFRQILLGAVSELESLPPKQRQFLAEHCIKVLTASKVAAAASSARRYEHFRRGTSRLRELMHDLDMLAKACSRHGDAPPHALSEIIGFMRTWGWAIAEHPEIEQWFLASPVFSQLKLTGTRSIESAGTSVIVLKPLRPSGPDGYRAECPTAPGSNDAPRKLTRDDRRPTWELDFDDYTAVAFNSGKIHIKQNTTNKTVAVGYVAGKPQSLELSADGTRLEVEADELTFFDVSDVVKASV